ncbi:MAG TPA: hypothetical protein VLX44_13670 [Xanthobacteraceae bacterium]|nr:hypothetical protein [Xanthobacteraceae bacterium]
MKSVLLAASAMMALAALGSANAQNAGPTYSNSIHQSAGDRDARGTPKYYHSERLYHRHGRYVRAAPRSTTGAGPSGPFYDNSIHQSSGGRDARGTPKYNEEK